MAVKPVPGQTQNISRGAAEGAEKDSTTMFAFQTNLCTSCAASFGVRLYELTKTEIVTAPTLLELLIDLTAVVLI